MTTSHPLVGTLLDDRYQIEGILGSGGMADVLLANDTTLGRKVAIKLLHDRYARDEAFVERFLREASAAARLNHPNIVQVYDRGEARGTYYITMEYMDGPTLKDIVKERGPLPDADVFSFSRQALAGLRFAHRNGIVHRDVKPHNFMVDSQGTLKIADFGIARAGAEAGLTEAGSIVGTAQYLSPEQAQGRTVSAASDLYAMGVVMFEMATGRVPYDGDQPVNVALRHVNDPVPVPASINPSVNPLLARVIQTAMQKDPAQRYSTADAFLADLEAAAAGAEPEGATMVLPAAAAAAAAAATYEGQTTVMDAPLSPPASGLDEEESPRRKWPWLLLALVVLAGGGLAWWALQGSEAEQTEVPRLKGMTVNEARNALEIAGLELGEVDQAPSDRDIGNVIKQTPPSGTEADEGSEVDIVISAGAEDVEVPDVTGRTEADAKSILGDAGFNVDVVESSSDSVEEGRVISQSPASGASVAPGSTISLVVSGGSDTEQVPPVVGLSESEARDRLRDAGFSVDATTVNGPAPAGQVIDQTPGASTALKVGETVSITVASGQNDVPNVIGDDPGTAETRLRDAGFNVTITEESVPDPSISPDGEVVEQDPSGGSQDVGTTVTIRVQRGTPAP